MPLDPTIAARIAACRETRSTVLDLWGTRATSVPLEILELTWLRRLNLPWNLRTLPPGIEALTDLEHLRLGTVHRLPDTLARLPNLRLLLFNGPTRPPEGLRHVPQIRTLELIYSKTTTPPDVAGLDHLEELVLHGGFAALPDGIGALSTLRVLRLDQNALTVLPPLPPRIEILQVGQNRLVSLLALALPALRSLDLNWNTLEQLPGDLGPFPELTYLNLERNRLRTLPATLLQAPKLESLHLSGNPWESLPDFSLLRNVAGSLSIGGVRVLPTGLGNLKKVRSLSLTTSPLVELPAEIGRMTALETLTAARCGVERVHPDIGRLRHLRHLDLRDNRITTLPASLAALPLGKNVDDNEDFSDSAYHHTPGLQLDGNPIDPRIYAMEPAEQIAALVPAGPVG